MLLNRSNSVADFQQIPAIRLCGRVSKTENREELLFFAADAEEWQSDTAFELFRVTVIISYDVHYQPFAAASLFLISSKVNNSPKNFFTAGLPKHLSHQALKFFLPLINSPSPHPLSLSIITKYQTSTNSNSPPAIYSCPPKISSNTPK